MAAGELIGCFALTEPTAGSDPSSMVTCARETDDGGWVLDGAKRWIGLASIAEVMVVWARTTGDNPGIRGFLVPAGTPGVTATPIEPKLSMRASIQCDVTFDAVQLGPEAILP
ncbi:acyl-CoA dehydrogenase family protein, partial [Pantoea sp. SIMBA_072]